MSTAPTLLRRSALAALLAFEASALALVAALVAGVLPVGPGAVAWAFGVVSALAIAVVVGLPAAAGRAARHGALLLGSAVFLLPFVWLVGTSFKQPEETFIYPPKWLPAPAAAPLQSPWAGEVAGETGGEIGGLDHAVRLGAVRLTDAQGDESLAPADWSAAGAATLGEDGLVQYDFADDGNARGGDARLTTEVAVPPGGLSSVSVRLRQDASWHGLSLAVDAGGRRYESADPLYLGVDGWREWGFALPLDDARDERDLGVWPLVDAGPAVAETPGLARLTLTIHPKGAVGATLAKWTQSYREAWYADDLWGTYVLNSLYLVVLTVAGQVLSCSMAAYAFSRLRWPGREWVFGLVLGTMMLPGMVVMVPQFLIFKGLGWYNTLLPLWAPAFVGTPFFIFLLRQFMLGVPRELEEAARIDGCSWWAIYWRIMLPLMRPALAAVAIFTFMGTWNEFMGPLIYLNDSRLYPLSLGLFNFRGERGSQFNLLMAASTLMTLPVIAVFFLAQRYFIEGVTLTGIKG